MKWYMKMLTGDTRSLAVWVSVVESQLAVTGAPVSGWVPYWGCGQLWTSGRVPSGRETEEVRSGALKIIQRVMVKRKRSNGSMWQWLYVSIRLSVSLTLEKLWFLERIKGHNSKTKYCDFCLILNIIQIYLLTVPNPSGSSWLRGPSVDRNNLLYPLTFYSSPWNFFLFSRFKEIIKGTHFESMDIIKLTVIIRWKTSQKNASSGAEMLVR